MRHICLIAAAALSGCQSCRAGPGRDAGDEPREPSTHPEPAREQSPPPLPRLDPASIGLESPDPSQPAVQDAALVGIKASLIKGDIDLAGEKLDEVLEGAPDNLEALFTKADLLLGAGRDAEAVPLLGKVLAARYPVYSARLSGTPSLAKLEARDPGTSTAVERSGEAARLAWAESISGPGAFLLVASAFPAGKLAPDEDEALDRGWVVYLDPSTYRFLPLTPRSSVAGFILDRAGKRLFTLSWRSFDREERDGEGETIRPALMHGVSVSWVDLTTFETGGPVRLSDDVVEVRLSIRSGHVLASVVALEHASNEGVETSLEVDVSSQGTRQAPKAPPGPMDLIVSYGRIEPPSTSGMGEDQDALPGGWRCIEPGGGARLCAVPTSSKSVLDDLILELAGGAPPVTVARKVGILQMDVL